LGRLKSKVALRISGADMIDVLRKLTRNELRCLQPGEWVAWGRSNWDNNPVHEHFAFWEAQVMAHPVRSAQEIMVHFNGHPHAVPKNMIYKVQPVIDVEDMHTQYDYNS
jgi:hypothetical protein